MEPMSDIIRVKSDILAEPFKANIIWFYYDYPDIKDRTRKIQIENRIYVIELYKNR